ncbi:MAG: DnaJ domain-containing protein [Microthrixaceae bacterium]
MAGHRSPDFYEVLGVERDAPRERIRAAFVAAARSAHPDVAGAKGEDRMRRLSEAWAVLGDPARRGRYDAQLSRLAAGDVPTWRGGTTRGSAGEGASTGPVGGNDPRNAGRRIRGRATITPPEDVPFRARGLDEDVPDPRDEPDVFDPATATPSWARWGPVVLLCASFAVGFAGAVLRQAPLVALAVVLFVVAVVAFVAAPMLMMARAVGHERRTR